MELPWSIKASGGLVEVGGLGFGGAGWLTRSLLMKVYDVIWYDMIYYLYDLYGTYMEHVR